MRTIVPVVAAAVLAAAFSLPAAAEVKIGVIDMQQLRRAAPQIQAADAKLKAEFQKREDDLRAEGKKLEDDIRKFQREADTLSLQQRTSTQNDLNTRRTNFDIKQREFGEQFQVRNNELQREVLGKMKRAVDEVAKEKALDVILQDPVYADAALDVTPAVLAKLQTYGTEPAPAKGESKKKK